MGYLFTSESVSGAHPDKLCDQISDGVLDALLAEDPASRVACEVAAATGFVVIMGEITTTAWVDYRKIAKETIRAVGYDNPEYGFSADSVAIIQSLNEQSADIKGAVDTALEARDGARTEEFGAGDQGLMFGYATNETPELMPLTLTLAHKLVRRVSEIRKTELKYLRPDAKSQVTAEYDDNNRPVRINTVVLSVQHDEDADKAQMERDLTERVIQPQLGEWWHDDIRILVNPSGNFVIGGPVGDVGLTGRKIIVDTYGGAARHGGGAFSGKDPTKVDRSAAYAARYVAKNVVTAGLAERVELQLAYAIGKADPVSININSFGTNKIADERILELIKANFDLRPGSIISTLNLRRPLYQQVAAYGHFGRSDLSLPWEQTDVADTLRREL